MMLAYISEGGYQYSQRPSGQIVRISCNIERSVARRPLVGDRVKIIVKPYNAKKYVIGVIQRVLTRKQRHTRGHKVMLEDGTVGRMIAFA